MSTRSVAWDGGRLVVRFRFHPALKDAVKAIPGARFDWNEKVWWFPTEAAAAALPQLASAGFDVHELVHRDSKRDASADPLEGGAPTVELPELPEHVGIRQLNAQVARALQRAFPTPQWVVGELQGYERQAHRRHLYVDLVERDGAERVSASVTAVVFQRARERVEQKLRAVGLSLEDGMQVRLRVRVELYEARGSYQVVVEDIDATFSAGELALRREEVLRAVREAGLAERNRSLPWPTLPLRVALLTSADSDAYHDVLSSLQASGYAFDVHAYDVRVQGAQLAPTVTRALAALRGERYDVVLITRGGGSRVELSAWDDLAVAMAVVRCPIKVVVAIGHEQDTCALDDLAASFKTPTAAADELVAMVDAEAVELDRQHERLVRLAEYRVRVERQSLLDAARSIRNAARVAVAEQRVDAVAQRLGRAATQALALAQQREQRASARLRPERLQAAVAREGRALERAAQRIAERSQAQLRATGEALGRVASRVARDGPRPLREQERQLAHLDARLRLVDPAAVLRRGFAWVRDADGASITSATSPPEHATVVFHDGAWRVHVDPTDGET